MTENAVPSDILKKRAAVRTAETLTKRKGGRVVCGTNANVIRINVGICSNGRHGAPNCIITGESSYNGNFVRGGKGPSVLWLTSNEFKTEMYQMRSESDIQELKPAATFR